MGADANRLAAAEEAPRLALHADGLRPADLLTPAFGAGVLLFALGSAGRLAFDGAAGGSWLLLALLWILMSLLPAVLDFDRLPSWAPHAVLVTPCALLLCTPSIRGYFDPVVAAVVTILMGVVYGWGRGKGAYAPQRFLHLVSPVVLSAFVYVDLKALVPIDAGRVVDGALAALDVRWFGGHWSVWTDGIPSPLLNDWFAFHYAAYLSYPVVAALVLYARRDRDPESFDDFALAFTLGMYVSFLGYLAVPAAGPYVGLADLYRQKVLHGSLGITEAQWALVDRYHYLHDAFPSMHCCNSLVSLVALRRSRSKLFWLFLFGEVNLLVSTVWLRMHYTVDLLAGAALAVVLIAACPRINRAWAMWRAARGSAPAGPPPRTAS